MPEPLDAGAIEAEDEPDATTAIGPPDDADAAGFDEPSVASERVSADAAALADADGEGPPERSPHASASPVIAAISVASISRGREIAFVRMAPRVAPERCFAAGSSRRAAGRGSDGFSEDHGQIVRGHLDDLVETKAR